MGEPSDISKTNKLLLNFPVRDKNNFSKAQPEANSSVPRVVSMIRLMHMKLKHQAEQTFSTHISNCFFGKFRILPCDPQILRRQFLATANTTNAQ